MARNCTHVVALCTLLAVLGTSTAHAAGPTQEQIEEGKGHFSRGVEFYKENDFRAAFVEFKRAYDTAPNYKVLYNLGYTSLELQDYASALRFLERYLPDGGADVSADRKSKVGQDIDKLQKRVARITIDVNVDGAESLFDDVTVGKSPLTEPVLVSAGRRRIVATKAGVSQTRVIDVAGGESQKLALELQAAPGSTGGSTIVLPPAGATTEPEKPSSRTALWITIGVTGALGVGTLITGVLALSAHGKFDDTVNRSGATTTEVDDARSKTRTLALVTDILGGATIVSAIVNVIVGLTTSGSKAPPKDTAPGVSFQLSPFGAALTGRF
ncbi:hypothetical protein BH09MYX1_BH09MYX1_53500 [soil metagenome]